MHIIMWKLEMIILKIYNYEIHILHTFFRLHSLWSFTIYQQLIIRWEGDDIILR